MQFLSIINARRFAARFSGGVLRSLAVSLVALPAVIGHSASDTKATRPNVLLIVADDLNDWIAPLDGARAFTPNLDRIAARSTVFTRAYCSVPACAPSRTSFLTGVAPTTSGVYFNSQPIAEGVDWFRTAIDLPRHFRDEGYLTVGLGKIFHHGRDQDDKADSWTPERYRGYSGRLDTEHQRHAAHTVSLGSVWPGSWGWYDDSWDRDDPSRMQQDTSNSIEIARLLGERHDRPFFFALGLFRPHSKWFVAKRYYDLYPEDEIRMPEGWREGDLDDVPLPGQWLARTNVTPDTHRTLVERRLWRSAMRAYLASITYADEQIGRVLDALDSGPHAGNTIIVFLSDHGYHLGEKEHWNKFTLWERSARVPLTFSVPSEVRRTVDAPVSLLDLYPTLVDVAGLHPPGTHRLDGVSLRPLIEGKATTRGAPVITTYGQGNHAVRDDRWRYIRYRTGDEELYDHTKDPDEWVNLAGRHEFRSVMERLRAGLPENEAKNSGFQDARDVEWLGREIFGPQ